ncbi:MAG: hypothetical protein SFX72_18145 [Isosphaeraceae bacterium]|nr:hypothetical protein [Isosphaeraceae bacterium]
MSPFVADLRGVLELGIEGSADLDAWRARTAPRGVEPIASGGRARVAIHAISSRFGGTAFRELVVGVEVRGEVEGAVVDGIYLDCAFNSSRMFALLERWCFATPYRHALVELDTGPRARIRVATANVDRFTADFDRDAAGPGTLAAVDWDGPIFLPAEAGSRKRRWFRAKIAGETRSWEFEPHGRLSISAEPAQPEPACLVASGFRAERFVERLDARHARTKTFAEGAGLESKGRAG